MKKLIIFDLDGTLLDTLHDLNKSVNFALSTFNLPQKSIEHTRISIGNGVSKLIERSLPEDKIDDLHSSCLKTFREHYSKNYGIETKPYIGMPELVKHLKNDGYKLAVCTNKLESIAIDLINKFYPTLFDIVIGDNTEMRTKPDPEMLVKACSNLGVSIDEGIYVGDTNVDIEVSENAHIENIIVTFGYRTKAELFEFRKEIKNLADLPDDIYRLIKSLSN